MTTKIPEDIKKIKERISALKKKQNKMAPDENPANVGQVFVGLRLGVEFASGTFIGAALGYMLDVLFDFDFIFLLIFTILGSFAGILNMHRYLKKIEQEEKRS